MGGAAMSRTETLPTMPPLLSAATMPPAEPGQSHPAPVLILVPHVVSSAPRRTNLDSFRTRSPRPRTIYRPRRRLRRQFRVAVYAVAGLLPLLLAWSQCTDAYSIRHTAIPLLSIPAQRSTEKASRSEKDAGAWLSGSAARTSPTSVLLSIEPAGAAVDSDEETAVVFPGYLLPDDHHEEPVHEGS